MLDRKAFYDALRQHVNLTTQNVSGMDRVLEYGDRRGTPLNHMAYVLATAWWETGQTMQPVREAFWLNEAWRKKNLRYWPYYGRVLIQTTWKANYATMSKVVGVDLVNKPDLLLEWKYALPALFVGMERGLYTGKDLDDYIDTIDESDAEDLREFANARRIVNGTDKQITIGKLALAFEKALRKAGYDERGTSQTPPPPDIPKPDPVPAKPPSKPVTKGEGAVGAGTGAAAIGAASALGFDVGLAIFIGVAVAIITLVLIHALKR